MRVCVCACVRVCVRACVRVWASPRTIVCVSVCMCMQLCMYVYVCMHVCVCVFVTDRTCVYFTNKKCDEHVCSQREEGRLSQSNSTHPGRGRQTTSTERQ